MRDGNGGPQTQTSNLPPSPPSFPPTHTEQQGSTATIGAGIGGVAWLAASFVTAGHGLLGTVWVQGCGAIGREEGAEWVCARPQASASSLSRACPAAKGLGLLLAAALAAGDV